MLFVGALWGGEKRERVADVARQLAGDVVQRLFPSSLFQGPIPANQGRSNSGPAVDELQAELSLEAGLSTVGGGVDVGHRTDQPVRRVDFQIELAADGAMGANGVFNPRRLLPFVLSFDQGAYRAHVYTGTAELATRLQERRAEGRPDQRRTAAFGEAYRVVAPELLTRPDAPAANYAKVVVPVVEGVGNLQRDLAVLVLQGGLQFHPQVADRVLQLAPLVFGTGDASVIHRNVPQANVAGAADINPVAGEATVGMFGYEHLHHRAAQIDHVRGLTPDFHLVLHGKDAGCRIAPPPLYTHDAHATGGERFHSRVVAKVRDVHSGFNGGFQHHFPGLGSDLHPIYRDGNVIGHTECSTDCSNRT